MPTMITRTLLGQSWDANGLLQQHEVLGWRQLTFSFATDLPPRATYGYAMAIVLIQWWRVHRVPDVITLAGCLNVNSPND